MRRINKNRLTKKLEKKTTSRIEKIANNDESGATIVIFALSITMIIGIAGLVVDGGSFWSQERNLATVSDAAALAGAEEYIATGNGCSEAETFANLNHDNLSNVSCVVNTSGGQGSITVTVQSQVRLNFMGALGFSNPTAESVTVVEWEQPEAAGVRPFGTCADNADIAAWLANPTAPTTVRIFFDESVAACGNGVPGNWGSIDFNGGANTNAGTIDWIQNGYNGPISTTPVTDPCGSNTEGCISGDTGSFSGSHNSALRDLRDSGETFESPLFSAISGNGSGADIRLSHIVEVRLVGYKVNGNSAGRYVDLELQANGIREAGGVNLRTPEPSLCGNSSINKCS